MNFQIVTDSCCDFTDAEYSAMNVACVPLSVMWDGQCHNHFSNESELKAFYQQMRNGLIATTSALNPDNWTKAMEPFLKEGRDLLVLAVSSGISTTYQSAMIAAADLKETYPQRVIQVVDSLSGSLGEGLLLWHACRMRDTGLPYGCWLRNSLSIGLFPRKIWLPLPMATVRRMQKCWLRFLKNEYGIKHILKGYVGPILGAHTGPGVLGLFHIGIQR